MRKLIDTEPSDYISDWRRFNTNALWRRDTVVAAAWRGYDKYEFVDAVRRFGVPWIPPGLRYRRPWRSTVWGVIGEPPG
jgi:hypothetical protein